jgi:hypothetical protein
VRTAWLEKKTLIPALILCTDLHISSWRKFVLRIPIYILSCALAPVVQMYVAAHGVEEVLAMGLAATSVPLSVLYQKEHGTELQIIVRDCRAALSEARTSARASEMRIL